MKIILYKIMLKRKLSIRQVSILTGVSKSTIQKTMAELSNPTICTMEKLAAGLNISIESLYESDYK
ncbi:helix-turn-helix transcriptional regulator [Schaedlerella sp.]|uniref:helix-turn-helix domain-containing protein n=1 Tax=Schaedlerella sp. TaxID=2676057 RepID=UPI001363F246|nr:helix-turn-helix transcriptional regulator [Clostridiales bacterium]NBJ03177.1 XRE family transcriptional regulator [Lachnospiraceae bacterium]